jgi:hypothetical protein
VPAAAVTPAQMVYIKIVVIKKFVVGIWISGFIERSQCKYCDCLSRYSLIEQGILNLLKGRLGNQFFVHFTINKIECLKHDIYVN